MVSTPTPSGEPNHLGAGIDLYIVDNVSGAVQTVIKNYDNLTRATDTVTHKLNEQGDAVQSLGEGFSQYLGMEIGQNMMMLGEMLTSFTSKAISGIYDLGRQVADTGILFERFEAQLGTLFKESIASGYPKAKEEIAKIKKLAWSTPFEVDQLVRASVSFRAVGIDPFKVYKDRLGQDRELVLFAGDLAGAMGKSVTDAQWSIKEAAVNQWRSMMMRFDTSKLQMENFLGRKLSDSLDEKGIQDRLDGIVEYISDKFGGGMEALAATVEGIISNLKDSWTGFKVTIGDFGFYDKVKQTLSNMLNYLSNNLASGGLNGIAKSLSDTFSALWSYIDKASVSVMKFLDLYSDFSKSNPTVAKIINLIITFSTVTLFGMGMLLKFSGGLLMTITTLGLLATPLHNNITTMMRFVGAIKPVGLAMLGLAFVAGFLYLAWKYNFMGIQELVKSWKEKISNTFTELKKLHNSISPEEYAEKWQSLAPSTKSLERIMLWTETLTQLLTNDFKITGTLMDKLRAAGMEDEAVQLGNSLYKIDNVLRKFFDGLEILWKRVSPEVKVWLDFFGDLALVLLDVLNATLGLIEPIFNLADAIAELFGVKTGDFESSANSLKTLLDFLVLKPLSGMAEDIRDLADALQWLADVINKGKDIYNKLFPERTREEELAITKQNWDNLCGAISDVIRKVREYNELNFNGFNGEYPDLNPPPTAIGGIFNTPQVRLLAEDGEESIIPVNTSPRSVSLWEETGRRMGVSSSRSVSVGKVEISLSFPEIKDMAQIDKAKIKQIAVAVKNELTLMDTKEKLRTYQGVYAT